MLRVDVNKRGGPVPSTTNHLNFVKRLPPLLLPLLLKLLLPPLLLRPLPKPPPSLLLDLLYPPLVFFLLYPPLLLVFCCALTFQTHHCRCCCYSLTRHRSRRHQHHTRRHPSIRATTPLLPNAAAFRSCFAAAGSLPWAACGAAARSDRTTTRPEAGPCPAPPLSAPPTLYRLSQSGT